MSSESLGTDYPLSIYQGDTFVLSGTYKEGATVGTAVGVSLTGATMRGQIRTARKPSSTLVASFTITPDADQTANVGVWQAILSATDASLLDRARYWYDMQIVWPNGAVQTILSGRVNVTHEVTV